MEYGWINLHRHSEFSMFDGFGKQKHAAEYANNIGQNALGISEHGSVSGLVEHYKACKDNNIKPILGCEIYYQKEFNKEEKYNHLCLFCKDLKGYQNLMKIITEANINNFYRVAIVTEELLKQYNEGLICTSACIGGYATRPLLDNDIALSTKRFKELSNIFSDDFYVEIMPIPVMEDGKDIQKAANENLLKIIKANNYKGIITTDSHFIRREDYDTFQLMFKIGNKKFDIDYSDRYMPTEADITKRFEDMHKIPAKDFLLNTVEINNKCDVELNFEEKIPEIKFKGESDNRLFLKKLIKQGLKDKGKLDKEHVEKIKEELEVIFYLGFEDYFLLCWDIIKFALDNDIGYGHGRGSVCGSVVAYALNITSVDPLELGTIFERFLRKDKKKLPDIDMDFCSDRRHEVFEYIYKRFKGKAIQVGVYGYYKVNNLANDIGKALEMEKEETEHVKQILGQLYPELVHGQDVFADEILKDNFMKTIESKYGFVRHFVKMCGQIRYLGKHAGGVAITNGELYEQMAVIRSGGQLQSCYDLSNLDYLKVLKMDILGLRTVTILKELELITGEKYSDTFIHDEKILEAFKNCETTGIFQFDKSGAKMILREIEADNIQDIIAATALNRPAPLSMKMHEKFKDSKNGIGKKSLSSRFLPDTYGCLVYQEDIFKIGKGLSELSWESIDKIMKGLKETTDLSKKVRAELKHIKKEFTEKALIKYPKLSKYKNELDKLFEDMTGGYLFNKGHAAGYVLLSVEQMFFKCYYPLEFWWSTLKNENDEFKQRVYEANAVKAGCVILPPHVNGTSNYDIVEFGGGKCLSKGIKFVKGIGPKAADNIEENAPYLDFPDFEDRVNKRIVNKRVMQTLKDIGALEFDNKQRIKQIRRLNTYLAGCSIRIN